MKKRNFILFLSLFVFLCFTKTNIHANEYDIPYIYDDANVLTSEQYQTLHEDIEAISKAYQCNVHIVTIKDTDITVDTIQQFAEDVYEYNYDFGYGEKRDGYLLVLNVETRCYWLLAYGPFGNYSLTDYGKDWLIEKFLPEFGNNNWYNGLQQYIKGSEYILKTAITDKPLDKESSTNSTPIGIGLALLTGTLSAFFSCNKHKNNMQTAKLQTQANQYVEHNNIEIIQQHDSFTHTTTTRSKISTENSQGTTVNDRGFSGKGGTF